MEKETIDFPNSDGGYTTRNVSDFTFTLLKEPPNPYGRISDIAARLGVAPHQPDMPATTLMPGRDGQMYDVFAVIERFLDRLDALSSPPSQS
jgi:hypothetical protein